MQRWEDFYLEMKLFRPGPDTYMVIRLTGDDVKKLQAAVRGLE